MSPRPSAVVVLAAGEGTRMKSALPKVMHRILGRTLLGHVLAASAPLGADHTIVVVGHGRDAVIDSLIESEPQVLTAVQEQQRGTGHAVRIALAELARAPQPVDRADGPIVVLAGDAPLITSATLIELLAAHDQSGAAATVLSARLDDPTGYGRIVRG
ncbi:MAG TPA: NTP transferase domain-containing protein, partial [Candidatus Nanopelagicales bacterium]